MNLNDYINRKVLDKAILDGYVERKDSPCGNFFLLDYTRDAIFDNMWNDASIRCRGLVVDSNDDTIVGMCLPKFHNLSEGAEHHQREYKNCVDNNVPFVATEKMDGSFGNVWWDKYQSKWRCSTRGSFQSEQALWANEYLSTRSLAKGIDPFNLIVEIIYPENRVVVDYGDKKELVLLTGFDHTTRKEFDRSVITEIARDWELPTVAIHHFASIDEIVAKCEELDGNHEGYVLRFQNGFRVKCKGKEYSNLHRILSGLSTKSVHDNLDLEEWKINDEWLKFVPEEFRSEIESFGNKMLESIKEEYEMIQEAHVLSIQLAMDVYGGGYTKKEYCVGILQKHFPKALFHKILLVYGGNRAKLKKMIYDENKPEFRKMSMVGDE